MVLLLCAMAQAAEVTEMPPALRLDGSVSYVGAFENGSLREDGKEYGSRHFSRHSLSYRVEFAPIDGLSVWLALEHTVQMRLAFEDASTMALDPATDEPTLAGGTPLDIDPVRTGAGLDGVWFGVGGTPFVEHAGDGPQATWRLDAAMRTPDPAHTFWTSKDGQRGTTNGGLGLLARAAFSAEREPADIYLVLQGLLETPAKVDVVDQDGTVRVTDAKVNAADRVDVRTGAELTAWAHATDGSDFGFDLFGGFGYVGYAKVPSGVLLPDVLERTQDDVVSSSAYTHFDGGVGMYGHVFEWVALRGAFTFGWTPAHRPEEPYPEVIGGDTVPMGVEASVEGRWR